MLFSSTSAQWYSRWKQWKSKFLDQTSHSPLIHSWSITGHFLARQDARVPNVKITQTLNMRWVMIVGTDAVVSCSATWISRVRVQQWSRESSRTERDCSGFVEHKKPYFFWGKNDRKWLTIKHARLLQPQKQIWLTWIFRAGLSMLQPVGLGRIGAESSVIEIFPSVAGYPARQFSMRSNNRYLMDFLRGWKCELLTFTSLACVLKANVEKLVSVQNCDNPWDQYELGIIFRKRSRKCF